MCLDKKIVLLNESKKKVFFPTEERIIQLMDPIMADSEISGLFAIAINKNGEKIEYSYGNAIRGEDSPIKSNNIFRISSMTKLVTSIAALQLIEIDSIDLDEDLSLIIPEIAAIQILTNEKIFVKGKNEIVSYGSRKDEGSQMFSEFPDRIPKSTIKNYNGGGGLFSSPEDYTKLLACLLNDGIYQGGQLLQKSTIDELFKDQTKDISLNI